MIILKKVFPNHQSEQTDALQYMKQINKQLNRKILRQDMALTEQSLFSFTSFLLIWWQRIRAGEQSTQPQRPRLSPNRSRAEI